MHEQDRGRGQVEACVARVQKVMGSNPAATIVFFNFKIV